MTSSLLAPRRRTTPRVARPSEAIGGGCEATAILDWRAPEVTALVAGLDAPDDGGYLRAAHQRIAATVRPVYAMDELQRVSRTLAVRRGCCSQRLAVLEACARSAGIATRVRGIVADGEFWYARFPRWTWLVPERVVLAWPEFRVDDAWLETGELFGPLDEMAACGIGFSNTDGETLFDAIGRTAVDWGGRTGVAACDLSALVQEDLGHFDSRDELFATHGQTLSRPALRIIDPVLGRTNVLPRASQHP
ncbi:transglutaminase domain-containing protein [Nocardioides sp. LML1-1-1.1]|uniref:transglutaminase domain-containing protein n=1 Tax=Nocardioides sp. LML1-1-1.1 TaxID=3135248 RepID=UPI003426943C